MRGYGHAFDSVRMLRLASAGSVTADESGGLTDLRETPQIGLTARMIVPKLSVGTAGGAIRLRIIACNDGTGTGGTFYTIAASPPVCGSALTAAGADGVEVLVRFGTDWRWIKYQIDTHGTVDAGAVEVGLVRDGIRLPVWGDLGEGTYWNDGVDI